jgi:hypothetical protein
MAIRDDYLLRFLALLRQAIARIVKNRTAGRYTEALDVAREAQEKLFSRPTAELATRSLDDLIRLLRLDEPRETADEKVLAYASLLQETGLVYAAMDRNEPAVSCFQLALHVMLTVAVGQKTPSDELRATMRDLLALIPPDQLHPPVRELLRQAGASA